MKLKKRTWIMAMFAIMGAIFLMFPSKLSVRAATPKVVKVEMKVFYYDSQYKECYKLYGKTKSGKTVWTYKTKKYNSTEISYISWKKWKNQVVIFENGYLIKLNLQNGKRILKTKKPLDDGGYQCFCIDRKGNIYVQGWYGGNVYKISPKGKVIWKKDVSKKYELLWPEKITIKNGKVKVKCSRVIGSEIDDGHYVLLNAKNGKILKVK